jgi:hypothetical protein
MMHPLALILNLLSIFFLGVLLGGALVNMQARDSYRSMQMEMNERLMMRDVGRGSLYVHN